MLNTLLFLILSFTITSGGQVENQSSGSDEHSGEAEELTYKFWKDISPEVQDERFLITNATDIRRFQGNFKELEARLVALLDHMSKIKCSGSLITSRWVVTAAHCLYKEPEYVQNQFLGLTSRVNYAYKHAEHVYELSKQSDDVEMLENDFGLVLTAEKFIIANMPSIDAFTRDLAAFKSSDMIERDLIVFGYGEHTRKDFYERPLFAATLRVVPCKRNTWSPCFCGASIISGACAGDSGGPVFYNGLQIGVTSLGPSKCLKYPGSSQTVFTNLKNYSNFIYKTTTGPAENILREGGPNPHWLTSMYFTHTAPTPNQMTTTSERSLRVKPVSSSGCVIGLSLIFWLFVLIYSLE